MDAVQRLQHGNIKAANDIQKLHEDFTDAMYRYNNASPKMRQNATDVYNNLNKQFKRRIEINTRMIEQYERGRGQDGID